MKKAINFIGFTPLAEIMEKIKNCDPSVEIYYKKGVAIGMTEGVKMPEIIKTVRRYEK